MTGANDTLTRREAIIHRTTTGIVLAVMVFSIVNFVFNDHFPFPNGPERAAFQQQFAVPGHFLDQPRHPVILDRPTV